MKKATGLSDLEVVAEERGKKISFLWMIHNSPSTKTSSTRPQQVLNSSLGNISSDIRPLVVVVDIVVTKSWSNIRCSLFDKDRLGVILAPHAFHFGHGVFY
ncbi:hypothetical protein Taro_023694 [Colocasia esculenta]|uniref:Uncharacterized protein n=1 Tax=Colocasia esculenta TaxID=4460 RepID=A0A843VBJ4_COLES|nr:hypothetical protein [Colocasia esculenta]